MTTPTREQDPGPELRARVLEAAQREPSSPRAGVLRRQVLLLVAGGLFSLLAFDYFGAVRVGGELATRPPWLVVATSTGAAAIATFVTWWVFARRQSMLPLPLRALVLVLLGTPLLLVSLKLALSSSVPDMTVWWETREGYRCLRLGLLLGAAPLLALLFSRLRSVPNHPTLVGAAFGVAAGACSWTLVDLWCPVGAPLHLLRGHVLPLILLAALGAALGSWLLPPRLRSSR